MDEHTLRQEAADWLTTNWTGKGSDEFVENVIDAGLAAPSWPVEWFGRGISPDAAQVVAQEFAKVGAPGAGQDVVNLWANTVLAFGSDELRGEHLKDLMIGTTNMCLLYSEPGAGSDLAGLQTRAERDGDEWLINGQKVWTSGGRNADFAFLIARTDWDVPKHRGISFFFMPMKQPGVEVRALRQATGDSRFNEVFLTNARVSHANMLGDLGQGWSVLQTALAYERAFMGESSRRRKQPRPKDAVRGAGDEAQAPVPDVSLIELAQATGRNTDPVIRQQLMELHSLVQVNRWNGQRSKAELEQGTSSSIVSLGKLAMSRILHTAGSLQAEILGAEAMTGAETSPRGADATYAMLNAFFTSIGGGTDQIQRNIIGERVLGLPREPEVDKGVAFREVRKATVTSDKG